MATKTKKKKAKDYYKDTRPELMQVFDSCQMPHMFGTEETSILIAGPDGAGNDTYHRWYPKKAAGRVKVGRYEDFKTEEGLKAGRLLNKWFIAHGMVWDKEDKYFHVLIHISW